MFAGSKTSLESELAEATQDLLSLSNSSNADRRSTNDVPHLKNIQVGLNEAPLPTPSPFTLASRAPSRNDQVDVGVAFGIHPKARITPLYDHDRSTVGPSSTKSTRRKCNEDYEIEYSSLASDAEKKHPPSIGLANYERFPVSKLHENSDSVGLVHAPSNRSKSVSPNITAVQEDFRARFDFSHGHGGGSADSRLKQQMELLQHRLDGSSSPFLNETHSEEDMHSADKNGSKNTLETSTSPLVSSSHRVPDFFLESFPDATSYMDRCKPVSTIQESASGTMRDMDSVIDDMKVHNKSSPFSGLQPTASKPSQATDRKQSPVTVKLYGNRRLEREAQLSSSTSYSRHSRGTSLPQNEQEDGIVYDATPDTSLAPANETLSPLQEMAPLPAGEDTSSLLSLPVSSTGTASYTPPRSRSASHLIRRRRSTGSHSAGAASSVTSDDTPRRERFARDVLVRGFCIVGGKARGHVAYEVQIVTQTGPKITILRRFSSFLALRRAIMAECGSSVPPNLPPRRSGLLHKYAAHHLEKRRRALQKWLATVMLDSPWCSCRALQAWVVGGDGDSFVY